MAIGQLTQVIQSASGDQKPDVIQVYVRVWPVGMITGAIPIIMVRVRRVHRARRIPPAVRDQPVRISANARPGII